VIGSLAQPSETAVRAILEVGTWEDVAHEPTDDCFVVEGAVVRSPGPNLITGVHFVPGRLR
jgi:hypothetical protein